MLYLMQATISVEADYEGEAVTRCLALCQSASQLGMGDCVLDDGQRPKTDGDPPVPEGCNGYRGPDGGIAHDDTCPIHDCSDPGALDPR